MGKASVHRANVGFVCMPLELWWLWRMYSGCKYLHSWVLFSVIEAEGGRDSACIVCGMVGLFSNPATLRVRSKCPGYEGWYHFGSGFALVLK